MAALQPLCIWFGIDPKKLSREENWLLEAELLRHICNALDAHYKERKCFFSHSFSTNKEEHVLGSHFVKSVIRDILATEQYTLAGIAYYTAIPEDVYVDVLTDEYPNPSVNLMRRIIDLHRIVRPELYRAIIKKIIEKELVDVDEKE